MDYNWRLGKRWGLNGYWAGSQVNGSIEAIDALQRNNVHSFQRPDADHVELDPFATSMRGHSGNINFGKSPASGTRMNVSLGYRSPGFEVNDLGFERRADEIPQNSWLQIRWDKPGRFTRNIRLNFNQWSGHNFDGDRLSLGGNINLHAQFVNLWNSGGGINYNAQNFDDRLTRGGPGGYTLPNVNGWYYLSTDDRKKVSFNWNFNFFRTSRSHGFAIEPSVTLRPTAAFSAEFGHLFDHGLNDAQWVAEEIADDRTRYVFATSRPAHQLDDDAHELHGDAESLGAGLRAAVRVVGQLRAVQGAGERPRAATTTIATRPIPTRATPDFKVLSFRTTNVMRWEYKPGSTLFVVWQQAAEGPGQPNGFHYGQDFGDVFSTPSSNAFLVKLAYWLNP